MRVLGVDPGLTRCGVGVIETGRPPRLVAVGLDGRPCQKTLVDLISEWCIFRLATVRRRSEYRLARANDRIHILEGRHIVFLNIDGGVINNNPFDYAQCVLMPKPNDVTTQAEVMRVTRD